MLLLGVDWTSVSGGNLLVAVSIIGAVFMLWRSSPLGADAVESWKNIAEGRKVELDLAVADAKRRFEEVQAEKARTQAEKDHAHDLKIQLAKCQEQPKTEELAAAVKRLADSFDDAAAASSRDFTAHRSDLVQLMTRIADGAERDRETIGSMHQALIVLVDRDRSNRAADAEGRDPPLST